MQDHKSVLLLMVSSLFWFIFIRDVQIWQSVLCALGYLCGVVQVGTLQSMN